MWQDVYRIKGVLSLAGCPSLYVFQGVCGELKGQAARAWRADEIRRSELVIIGKGLDEDALRAAFDKCLCGGDKPQI